MDIEPGIPIPPPYKGTIRNPFAGMKVDDSFARPATEQNSLRAAASQYKARHPGWDYETRIMGDVIRLWCRAVPEQEGTEK